jgi:hypothetical protein
MFGRLMQPMISFCDAPLAITLIGSNPWRAHEDESTRQRRRRQTGPYPK